MELKLFTDALASARKEVLIVPSGIETRNDGLSEELRLVLIVPSGIET